MFVLPVKRTQFQRPLLISFHITYVYYLGPFHYLQAFGRVGMGPGGITSDRTRMGLASSSLSLGDPDADEIEHPQIRK